jgi:hypothetical protein
MESLRRYVTSQDLINRGIASPTTFKIIQAERDIDSAIKNFYEDVFRPFNLVDTSYSANNCTFTTTTLTIADFVTTNNYFAYSAVEILSGANKGRQIAIESSTSSGNQTVLNFFDTPQAITPGNYRARTWQEGKIPMIANCFLEDQTWEKVIPSWLKDCVAYQYLYRENNPGVFNSLYPQKAYEVDQDQYREEFDTSNTALLTVDNRTSPDALSILNTKGLAGKSV